jgi:hypothetical protein
MAGTILRLMPRTDFDFGKVQASNSVIVWTSQNIDVSRYREGTMLVRVHALNIGTTATLVVALRAVQPSQEDPAQYFRSTTDLAFVVLGNGTAPQLQVAALPANFGGFVSLQLRASQPAVATTLIATLSVDLSLKD